METILTLTNGNMMGVAGVLAAMTSIVVQVLKNILPKKIPTKILTIIVAMLITIGYTIIFGVVSIGTILFAFFGGFVVAFIAMFGFDNFKETLNRFKEEK